MKDKKAPNFPLPGISKSAHAAAWNLNFLLYRGASAKPINQLSAQLLKEQFGPPIEERIAVVTLLHDTLLAALASGYSTVTVKRKLYSLKRFYKWNDDLNMDVTCENIQKSFSAWTDHLVHEIRICRTLKPRYAYDFASMLAKVIQEALELDYRLLYKSRLKKPKIRSISTRREKQNLEDTFTMGQVLVDIANSLTFEHIHKRLPVIIEIRGGLKLEEWCGKVPSDRISLHRSLSARQARSAALENSSLISRFPLLKLKIEAEMLIFIAQTGMNKAQAAKIKIGKFTYKSDTGGYTVRRLYKNRAKGTVEFHIYNEYRQHLESYVKWRGRFFPDDPDGLLFPNVGRRHREADTDFAAIRKRCIRLGIRFIPARDIRNTRANWLLRRSNDSSLTAEINQHTEKTLLTHYVKPNHQIALIEVSRFIHEIDPALAPPGPGACVEAEPKVIAGSSVKAPTPDCRTPAGCLFCEHQRDLKTLDHTWSLATYRYLKSLEIANTRTDISKSEALELTITELSKRLNHFNEEGDEFAGWVLEANARVDEGNYHPHWDFMITMMETPNEQI